MMTRNKMQNRGLVEFTSLDELVPEDHMVRKPKNAIDWSFIYELVEDKHRRSIQTPPLQRYFALIH